MENKYSHEPCSATLNKFHDSINNSFEEKRTDRSHATQGQMHPIIQAKQKFKYMTRERTYVDESLFGPSKNDESVRRPYNGFEERYASSHLTHQLMSNMTLMHSTPLSSMANTPRTTSARSTSSTARKRPDSSAQKRPVVPWRP